jgi:hypothetical protein
MSSQPNDAAKAAFIARPDVQALTAAVASIMASVEKDAAGHRDLQTPLMTELAKHKREVGEGYVRYRLPFGVYVGGALAQMRITRGSSDV